MAAWGIFALLALSAGCLLAGDPPRRWTDPAAGAGSERPGQRHREAAADGIADVPLLLELLGAALEAGLAVPSALELVAEVSTPRIHAGLSHVVAGLQMGASWEHSWEGVWEMPEVGQLHASLSFAALTGAPAAPLLYAEARQRRRQSQRDAEKRAGALGVKLVVPLGLCSLPAFICLGIVPVVVAMVPAF